jgi:putative transcriptional regulator
MYHYLESGLPNVWLANGYREVATPEGTGVAIHDVEGLHRAIAQALVEGKPTLSGAEVRFIRKLLQLTQAELGMLLGVGEQTVRNWESAAAVPAQADRGMRLVFRDMTRRVSQSLPDLIEHVASEHQWPAEISFRCEPSANDHWMRQAA